MFIFILQSLECRIVFLRNFIYFSESLLKSRVDDDFRAGPFN